MIDLRVGVLGLASCVLVACVSNHDALAKREARGSGGSGGSEQAGTDGSPAGASGASGDATGDAGAGGQMSDAADEPSFGPSTLTLLHAVVDVPRLAFCFERLDGSSAIPVGNVVPSAGLDYGQSAFVTSIPGVDPETDVVRVVVLTGPLEHIAGLSCAQVRAVIDDAGDAGDAATSDASDSDVTDAASATGERVLDIRPLPALPPGTLYGGQRLLLVAAGCAGELSHVDPSQEIVCGPSYTPATPTLTAMLVAMSDVTAPAKLALQIMNASRAADEIDVIARPPSTTDDSIPLVRDVVEGALRPLTPIVDRSANELGVYTGGELDVAFQGSLLLRVPWLAVTSLSGVSPEHGRGYVLVSIGPRPGLSAQNWWLASTITVVPVPP